MCGIAGTIGAFDEGCVRAVETMNRSQAHRGPDDHGLWQHADGARGVVFGHRRLSILDLSPGGHQPMVDEASGCVICFNGEVYNFAELREELVARGVTFSSTSDTEVILKAYALDGEAVISKLRGMFALAIWDPKRRGVLLVRDRLGKKPLYYTVRRGPSGNTVLFASELRALLATGAVERRIDPVGLATYLWNGFTVGPSTLVRDVALLPPGSTAFVPLDGAHVTPKAFWTLPSGKRTRDAAASRERLRDTLAEAVKLRLVSDVPLGIFLSGGVDSSAIASLAKRANAGPVRTFNIRFDEARYDESSHARAVAKAIGTEHAEMLLTGEVFRAGLGDALRSLDQPTFDAINTFFVSRAVREAGLTVALAGTGGDELFGGYSSFRDLPRARRASQAVAPVPEALLRAGAHVVTRLKLGAAGAVPPQTRWGKLGDVLASRGDMIDLYQSAYGLFTRDFAQQLSSAAAFAAAPSGVPSARREELERLIGGEPDLHAVSTLELAFFIGERLMRDTDTASMAVSLEVRVPLLDHEVVEAVAEVPEAARYAPLGRKMLLRELALSGVDPGLFDRPKAGFELPLELWCRQQLEAEIDSTLRDPEACARAGLSAEAVAKLWEAFREGAPGLYWSRVWALYVLLWWVREHDLRV